MGFDGHEHCDVLLSASEEDDVPRSFKVSPDRRGLSTEFCHGHILLFNEEVPASWNMLNCIHSKSPSAVMFSLLLPQFKAGVAILSRLSLDFVFSQPFMTDILEYERKPTRGNPYHGDLLRVQDSPSKRKNFIASTIAMVCLEKIITRE